MEKTGGRAREICAASSRIKRRGGQEGKIFCTGGTQERKKSRRKGNKKGPYRRRGPAGGGGGGALGGIQGGVRGNGVS